MTVDHPVVAAARELRPLLRGNRAESEERGRLSSAVLKEAGGIGLFRLYAPIEVGGLEVSPIVAAAAIEEVGAEDPAVGWYMINSVAVCLAAAYLGPDSRDLVFAERDRNFGFSAAAGGTATPTDGGYLLSGEWPLVTGVDDALWCALAGRVVDGDQTRLLDGRPDGRLFVVSTSDMQIDRIWGDAIAMRGTASQRVVIEDAFVPEDFAVMPAKAPLLDRPLFRLPQPTLGASVNGGISIGVLDGAIDAAAEILGGRVSTFHGGEAISNGAILELISRSDAAWRSLRGGLNEACEDLWATVVSGKRASREQRAAIHGMQFYAVEVARDVISQFYARSSRAAFFKGHPLERALRDIHAIAYGLEPLRPFEHSAGLVRTGHRPTAPGF